MNIWTSIRGTGLKFPKWNFTFGRFVKSVNIGRHLQISKGDIVNLIYDRDSICFPEDPELRVLGSVEKLAQWRHRNRGPAFMRIRRRIGYHGTDRNAYLSAQRVDPSDAAQ